MLVVMKRGSTPEDAQRVRELLGDLGFDSRPVEARGRWFLGLGPRADASKMPLVERLPGVALVVPLKRPVHRVDRAAVPGDTVFRVGPVEIGRGGPILIAGPCAVESEEQLVPLAVELKRAGADLLRGGAYKPRSSPHDFQGLGQDGLQLLARAREASGLPVVTEAVDEASLELVQRYADVVQIGARNMHNYSLLKSAGRSGLPVFLKRGFSATLEDLLFAAEYVLEQGDPRLMLCERGIRTFSGHSRFTLDLSIVPLLKKYTHLPVFVDPSHASGIAESVAPLARAAVAAGADGVMVEVHPDPMHALCDGPQSLLPAEFALLVAQLRALAPTLAGPREAVS